MKMKALAAVTAMILLAACRQGEDQANNSATGAAAGPANSATPVAAPVSAEQAQRIFHERHEGMEDVGKATKRVGRELESASPDLAVVRVSAATIDELAARSANWFPAGTGQNVLHKTRALPAIWQKPDDFAAKDRGFSQAAQRFNSAAQSGELDAIKSRFAELGKTCKACHDTYRAEKHPK